MLAMLRDFIYVASPLHNMDRPARNRKRIKQEKIIHMIKKN